MYPFISPPIIGFTDQTEDMVAKALLNGVRQVADFTPTRLLSWHGQKATPIPLHQAKIVHDEDIVEGHRAVGQGFLTPWEGEDSNMGDLQSAPPGVKI